MTAKDTHEPHSGDDRAAEIARRAREEIAEWIRSGNGPKIDLKAAEEVKYLGLEANYDE